MFSDIDVAWEGKRILVREGHKLAGQTAKFLYSVNAYAGFGLAFETEETKEWFLIKSCELDFIKII
jgi:hypothetical protein